MKTLYFLLLAFSAASLFVACDDDGPDFCATYEDDIKPIVDVSCAYAGCHAGDQASEFVTPASKDYTNYEGLLITLQNGSFGTRVLDSLDMPPFYTPDGNPKELSEDQKELIACWIEEGFPEK